MNFFGIGPWEIVLVLIIALLVVGPQRLPEVSVRLARAIRGLRRFAGEVTGQFRQEFDELLREYEALRAEVQDLRQQVDRSVGTVAGEADKALEETRQAVPSGDSEASDDGDGGDEKPAPQLPQVLRDGHIFAALNLFG